jgi:hypothetical protein
MAPYEAREVESINYAPSYLVRSDQPLVMGKLAINIAGIIYVTFSNNTNTKNYGLQVRGWISDRPFIVPRNLVP